ncbi:MAG: hypothetical protein LBT53_04850 [Puniceicoccales bacterium]|jgi:hypothetical protein|nr:hypothetical protein [Puniceicoccales bacterium]
MFFLPRTAHVLFAAALLFPLPQALAGKVAPTPISVINSQTLLCSPDWLNGEIATDARGNETRNGKTEAAERARRDVGAGEQIELSVGAENPTSPAAAAAEWTITEGADCAYFGEVHSGGALEISAVKGARKVTLNMRVFNEPKKRVVTVRVRTFFGTSAASIFGKTKQARDIRPQIATLTFQVFAPDAPLRSRHAPDAEQFPELQTPPDETGFRGKITKADLTAERVLGAWTVLRVFPSPTNINFGGIAEGGIKVIERDGNPDGVPNIHPTSGSIFANGMNHNPSDYFGTLDPGGFFNDFISYDYITPFGSRFPPYPLTTLTQDHTCEWHCHWYWQSGNFASEFNKRLLIFHHYNRAEKKADAETLRFLKDAKAHILQEGIIETFLMSSKSGEKGKISVSKFNSTVSRLPTGSTFLQTRYGDWQPSKAEQTPRISSLLPPAPLSTQNSDGRLPPKVEQTPLLSPPPLPLQDAGKWLPLLEEIRVLADGKNTAEFHKKALALKYGIIKVQKQRSDLFGERPTRAETTAREWLFYYIALAPFPSKEDDWNRNTLDELGLRYETIVELSRRDRPAKTSSPDAKKTASSRLSCLVALANALEEKKAALDKEFAQIISTNDIGMYNRIQRDVSRAAAGKLRNAPFLYSEEMRFAIQQFSEKKVRIKHLKQSCDRFSKNTRELMEEVLQNKKVPVPF